MTLMRVFGGVWFTVAAGIAVCTAQPNAVTVGTASAAPGQTASGVIDVPAGGRRRPVDSGHRRQRRPSGPVLALLAGAHGTEYASIIALEKLPATVDASTLSGTLVVVPLLNVPSFARIVPHLNPVDGKNMNRMYPGRPDGTQTERASYAVTRQVVERSDHLIDFHGGDIDENLRPVLLLAEDRPRRAGCRVARHGARVRPRPHHHHDRTAHRPGGLALSREHRDHARQAVDHRRGRPGRHGRTGGRGGSRERHPERDAAPEDAAGRARRRCSIRSGSIAWPTWPASTRASSIRRVERGSSVATGTTIGRITDYVGRPLAEVRAAAAGVVLYVRAVPTVNKGEAIASIGVIGKAPEGIEARR